MSEEIEQEETKLKRITIKTETGSESITELIFSAFAPKTQNTFLEFTFFASSKVCSNKVLLSILRSCLIPFILEDFPAAKTKIAVEFILTMNFTI